RAAAEEVTGVVICVEPDEIAVEEAGQESLADRQNTVDFAAGEGRVEEEADADILLGVPQLFADHPRKEHEVVVVDPNKVIILYVLDDRLGEEAIDFLVGRPCGLIES